MSGLPDGPLIAYYGDDFTGSAAVMEVMSFAGLDSVLFLDLLAPERLASFSDRRCIGIAGIARSRPPEWMDAQLPPIFEALARVHAPLVHYKTCSTFDSAPHIGSIAEACPDRRRRHLRPCHARARRGRVFGDRDDRAGLELALKGGQIGGADYFSAVRNGGPR
ncbi:MAG TPA: four-carbon acid sugar kinase family protein [Bosea sp. (in: a-proteobacteria)]|jgi:uncharacterized protein YgbK (DUF1537 family)|uniref:four-carbon acid sugar kinase family protein n=1 Tax=Bosea sp. (in: a-proteobacteria) TaxID=1871050 RepID=UPI002E15CA8A|nr:four-carbon acid sugar kinase family protein [Bosea sp. (in: a-proteobacteria)]